MDPLKILVLTSMYPVPWNPMHGGFVRDHVHALVRAGAEARVVRTTAWVPPVLRRRQPAALRPDEAGTGVPVQYAVMLRPPGRRTHAWLGPLSLAALGRRIARLRREFRFDIIHSHEVTPTGFAGVRLAHRHEVPSLCTAHGSDLNVAPLISRACYRQTQFVLNSTTSTVAVSQALARRARSIAPGARLEVIYNGVDVDRFRKLPGRKDIRQRLGIAQDAAVVAFAGNILPQKGVPELIRTAAALVRDVPALLVVIVGRDAMRGRAARLAAEVGIGKRVVFAGVQPHEQMPLWLNAADVLALPSYSEGLPVSVLEAMACEVPVAVSSVGGVPEVISDGKTGLLIEPGSAEALRHALVTLLSNPDLRTEMGKAAREFLLENGFTWEAHAQRFLALYRRVLAEFRPGPRD